MQHMPVTCLFCILLLVFTCGCTQPAETAPVTPAVQITASPEPVAVPTDTQRSLNFTVTKTEKTVTITYEGGANAADLTALKIRIDNQDSSDIDRMFLDPVPGTSYPFMYMGLADPVTANIIGTWNDGYQQTVLLYYF